MNKFSFNPSQGFQDGSAFPNPNGEQEVREQLQRIPNQLAEYINKIVSLYSDTDTVVQFRITEEGLLQYRVSDSDDWTDTASGGHIIFDKDGNQLPQQVKLKFSNATVYDEAGYTVVDAIGHQIYDENETLMPFRKKLMFRNTSVYNSGDFTVIEGVQGEDGVGVSSIVQVSSSGESLGQNVWRATLTNGNTYDFIVLNGARGEKGEEGEMGKGLVILGTYSALEDLQQAHPVGNEGDCYIVGTGDSNPAYVWDVDNQAWESIGKIRGEKGAKGDTGAKGSDGVGIQSIIETSHSSVSGGTNIWTVTLTNGAINTFTVLNGEKGDSGEGIIPGGSQNQVLAKNTLLDYDVRWKTVVEVPAGGNANQVLKKISNADYDITWDASVLSVNGETPDSSGNVDIVALPVGGTANQVLVKQSSVDGDADWETLKTLPTGGTANQIIVKQSAAEGDAIWQDPDYMTLDPDGVAGNVSPINADLLDGSTKQQILNYSTPQDISSTFATLSSGYSFLNDVNKQIIKLSSMIFYGAKLSPSSGSLGSGWTTLMTINSNYLPSVSLPITFILFGSGHAPLKYCDGEITTSGAVRIYNNQAISSGLVRIYTQFFYIL